MPPSIYLDHNATAPPLPEVVDAVREASLLYGGNPESQHEPGRQARRALEDAREQIGQLLGARTSGVAADRVIFTSGGTEANNLALLGLAHIGPPGRLLLSTIEHPCVLETAARLELLGWRIDRATADQEGVVQADNFAQRIRPETRLASLMLGNNETGVLQPVAEVARLCADRGVPVHTDASQVVGKLPVNFAELNAAALCCAAHKFHGPLGIGVLLLRHDVPLQPMFFGGHQQAGLRPGTESVALAVGTQTALECWHREAAQRHDRMAKMRDQFEQTLVAELPEAKVIGGRVSRLPNTSNIAFLGFNRQALAMALDQAGVACATGSACASGSSEPSGVLVAMGLERGAIEGSIRFSLGATTSAFEVEEAARRILSVCRRLRHAPNH